MLAQWICLVRHGLPEEQGRVLLHFVRASDSWGWPWACVRECYRLKMIRAGAGVVNVIHLFSRLQPNSGNRVTCTPFLSPPHRPQRMDFRPTAEPPWKVYFICIQSLMSLPKTRGWVNDWIISLPFGTRIFPEIQAPTSPHRTSKCIQHRKFAIAWLEADREGRTGH